MKLDFALTKKAFSPLKKKKTHSEVVCNVQPFQQQFFRAVTNFIRQITHDTSDSSGFQ